MKALTRANAEATIKMANFIRLRARSMKKAGATKEKIRDYLDGVFDLYELAFGTIEYQQMRRAVRCSQYYRDVEPKPVFRIRRR